MISGLVSTHFNKFHDVAALLLRDCLSIEPPAPKAGTQAAFYPVPKGRLRSFATSKPDITAVVHRNSALLLAYFRKEPTPRTAQSSSTISRTKSWNITLFCQPNFLRALVLSPRNKFTSAGRNRLESMTTYLL